MEMKELTDEEVWDLLLENKEYVYFFAHKMTKRDVEQLMSYIWEAAFTRIKSGDLNKGSLGQVLYFAAQNGRRNWMSMERTASIRLPRHIVERAKHVIDSIRKDLHADVVLYANDKRLKDGKRILKNADAHVVVNSLVVQDIEDFVWDSVLHVQDNRIVSPDAHIVLGDAPPVLFSKEYGLTGKDLLKTLIDAGDYRTIDAYVLARRFGLEVYALKTAPHIFKLGGKYDLVSVLAKERKLRKDIEEDVNHNNTWRVRLNPDGATLREIGEELSITRERVRQIEKRAIAFLQQEYEHIFKELE